MRAGGCTVQQTLTAEAASVVKHAVALARQRGHAQVTPLHVAATLLAPGAMSLLRRACLKSHPHSTSHPLQCRALELCFKVALNRLPTASGPLMQPGQPSLSNALVAALKRAQAHQRRGFLEQQQQPLLAVKVEMEQLIISILDDPSVSRVMREAGFSSTFVKNNLEDETSVSVNVNFLSSSFHDNNDVSVSRSAAKIKGLMAEAVEMGCGVLYSTSNSNYGIENNGRTNFFNSHRSSASLKSEDVESVFEVLVGKKARKTNSVIVGDCFVTTENVVREVMSRIQRGEVPDPLRGVQFITPHFSTFILTREQVEQKLAELRRTVNNCLVGGSAIIYAGDLRWAVDNNNNNRNNSNNYCPVEHISMELGRMLGSHAANQRVWLMATASYETYMRCQKRQPSLETLWGLQAVSVPSGGLALTLQASSSSQAESKTNGAGSDASIPLSHNLMWPTPPLKTVNPDDELLDKLNCCSKCSASFETEADFMRDQERRMVASEGNLPFWLRQCRNNKEFDAWGQVGTNLRELRKKWNQRCRFKHSHFFDTVQLQRSTLDFPRHPATVVSSTPLPWRCAPAQSHAWSVVSSSLPSSKSPWSHQFSWSTQENVGDSSIERTASVQDSPRFDVKTTLALGLADTDDNAAKCTASSHLPRVILSDARKKLRQFDSENLKDVSEVLAERVPWQSEGNVTAIASAVLQCRSGAVRRESSKKGDTWLMVLGPDRMGKRKMAQALAEIVFGSQDKLLCLGRLCSRERMHEANFRGKTYLDRLTQAIDLNPHCVVLLEEIEQADAVFMGTIVKAMERGKLMDSNGREVSLSDTIVFMTSSLGAKYFTTSRSVKGVQLDETIVSKALEGTSWGLKLVVQEQIEESSGHHPRKRKAEWDPMQDKETEKRKRMSPALDLNVDADEQTKEEHNQEAGSSSAHSDVTQETVLQTGTHSDQILSCARDCFSQQFFKFLDKCIIFQAFDFAQLAEILMDKLQDSFRRATNGRGSLEVENSVMERMVSCSWELAPLGTQTFDRWVEDIFEVGLAPMLSKYTLTSETIVKLSAAEYSNGRDCFYSNTRLPARLAVDPSAQS